MSAWHRYGLAGFLYVVARFAVAAAPIDCDGSKFAVDRFVCADPALLQRVDDARRSYAATRPRLNASDRELFDAADRFWHLKRNDCSNVDPATGAYRHLEVCVPEVLDAQARYLQEASVDPRSIREHIAIFDQVDASYLAKHGRLYIDRHVRVMGAVRLDRCAASRPAQARGRLMDRTASLPIRFDGLSDGQWDFLCTKQPFSSWTGTVRDDHGRRVLVADDVLGAPLDGRAQ